MKNRLSIYGVLGVFLLMRLVASTTPSTPNVSESVKSYIQNVSVDRLPSYTLH